jgi:hypothetical protein
MKRNIRISQVRRSPMGRRRSLHFHLILFFFEPIRNQIAVPIKIAALTTVEGL